MNTIETIFVLPKQLKNEEDYEQLVKLRRSAELFAPEDKKLIEALDKLLKNYTETTNPK